MQLMGVRIEMRHDRLVGHVQHSCKDNLPALVHDITILDYIPPQVQLTDAGEFPKFPPPHCQLQANMIRSGEGDFPAAGWEYGAQMTGYTFLRDCKPLQTGRRYSVDVVGSGVGGVQFEIRPD